jgi:hypothetical protein
MTEHPKIKSRMLIAVNVQTLEIESSQDAAPSAPKIEIELPDGVTKQIALFKSSNIPGQDLAEFSISAFGSHILSGFANNDLSIESGTSEAAPLIAGTCVLIKQKHPEWNGVKIVEQIKNTVMPVSKRFQSFYGLGILNASNALEAR